MIDYNIPKVDFLGQPNLSGYNTNIELILSANGKTVDVIAQVSDCGSGFGLYGDIEAIASDLNVTEDQLYDVIESPEFDSFCEAAVAAEYWSDSDLSPAKAYLNDEESVEVVFDCQVAPRYWSTVVIKQGVEVCVLATNSSTGEVKVQAISEDDLAVIADELRDKPWSDYKRAEYLLSWVGA